MISVKTISVMKMVEDVDYEQCERGWRKPATLIKTREFSKDQRIQNLRLDDYYERLVDIRNHEEQTNKYVLASKLGDDGYVVLVNIIKLLKED